jgi:hypothetical protein
MSERSRRFGGMLPFSVRPQPTAVMLSPSRAPSCRRIGATGPETIRSRRMNATSESQYVFVVSVKTCFPFAAAFDGSLIMTDADCPL